MARKVVGVGSVGTRAWVFLLVGRDGKDPLVLQAKEAQASHLGASEFASAMAYVRQAFPPHASARPGTGDRSR